MNKQDKKEIMNIFDLSVEEIKTEFQKILDSYSDEELIEKLKKYEEVEE